jgi:streptomycin 6-kinase
VPSEFAAMIASREGRPGRAWISALPDRVEDLLDAWALRVDGPTRSGYVAIVVPVMCADGTSAVLKVSYPDEESRSEGPALRTMAGDGAVRLLAQNSSGIALLLERADADRSLLSVGDAAPANRSPT